MRPTLAVILLLPVLGACTQSVPEAKLTSNDIVQFVRANRGHEIVVRKGQHTARMRLVGLYAFDPSVRRKNEIVAFADMGVRYWEKRYPGKQLTVVLERSEPDPRGRFLGYLYDGEHDVGELLLREGIVAAYTEYPWRRERDYFAAETVAREKTRGLWAGEQAVARLRALRETWSSVHRRKFGTTPKDPWLGKGSAQ